ncbi:hypothetical protein, partial [Legionella bononiensis]|uniref:hypothetical protein n=1 Tax=Legionella bononiensis TaxID=2793102 RepID=UPI001931E2DC
CQLMEILRCAQDDVVPYETTITPEHVIPNAMRDLQSMALYQLLEILRCAQDDVVAYETTRTPEHVIPIAIRDHQSMALWQLMGDPSLYSRRCYLR